jgi:hypothetical protein
MIGILYTLTALTGLYWSIYLTMTGLYGVPFSRWYVVVFIGGVVLLIGAVLWWTTRTEWTRWLPISGSLLLAAYFIPAFVTLVRRGSVEPLPMLLVGLIIASLVAAIMTKDVSGTARLPSK